MDSIPPGSWDTHIHVFDPINHPYIPNTRYTPPARSVADLVAQTSPPSPPPSALLSTPITSTTATTTTTTSPNDKIDDTNDGARARAPQPSFNYVVVMSGPEGTSTALTVEAMRQLRADPHRRQARGVVVLDLEPHLSDAAYLRRLDAAGVRSVRFNTRRDGDATASLAAQFDACARHLAAAGLARRWSVEAAIFSPALWAELAPTLRRLRRELGTVFVADHLFAAQPDDLHSPVWPVLIGLVRDGVVVVKISGLTRYGRTPEGLRGLIEGVLRAREEGSGGDGDGDGDGDDDDDNDERRGGFGFVFGSDWPHVDSTPGSTALLEVDMPAHLEVLKGICAGIDGVEAGRTWVRLMRDNAAELYA